MNHTEEVGTSIVGGIKAAPRRSRNDVLAEIKDLPQTSEVVEYAWDDLTEDTFLKAKGCRPAPT
jgi:hypothetical protein